jgi:hypothetical protein
MKLLGSNPQAKYDATRPLIIDPVLSYGAYLGGNNQDSGRGIAADADGNAYVTGFTQSADFPTTSGALQGDQLVDDAFVVKLDPNQSGAASLLYATYLGGNNLDVGSGIAAAHGLASCAANTAVSGEFPAHGLSTEERRKEWQR